MSQLDSFRDTFFVECEDLLESMHEGFHVLSADPSDTDTVHSVFRAVHSIKGAAGAFGFDDLVSFAHAFETVLDEVRGGKLAPIGDTMSLLLRSGDMLSDQVDAARDGMPPPNATELLEQLKAHHPTGPEDEFVFDAVCLDADIPTSCETYVISFAPQSALFRNGHDPVHLFTALQELGDLKVDTDVSNLPELCDLDPENCYLRWSLTLETEASIDDIRDVFEFVDGLCDLDITEPASSPPTLELPPTADPQPATHPAPTGAPRQTLRVDVDRVERLINSVGELIINQASLAQEISSAGLGAGSEVLARLEDYKTLAREIQEAVMAIRAQPVRPLFQRMERIAREVAHSTGKPVNFIVEGAETEVDKTVVERLTEPLTHMVRNAIDHGLETTVDRQSAGKPETGTVTLSACHRSGSVVIEITDDGAGLDRKRIFDAACRKGLIDPDTVLTEAEIDNLLFMPGFSTASEVTNLSGRGVGMDVVRTEINALGGRISITSTPGKGTRFTIALPLTLAVLDGMIIEVENQTMVVPISAIEETIRPTQSELPKIGKRGVLLSIRGAFVPVLDLGCAFGLRPSPTDPETAILLLIRTHDDRQIAIAVDAIDDQRQVVIKSLEGNYGNTPGVSAATILGNGQIALIVDPDAIAAMNISTSKDISHDLQVEVA